MTIVDIVELGRSGRPWNLSRTLDTILPPGATYHALSARRLPVWKNRPWICSVLDTIPLDMSEYSRFGVLSRLALRNAARADIIVTLSQYSALRLASHIPAGSPRIEVCSLPVEASFFNREVGPSARLLELHQSGSIPGPFVISLVDQRTHDVRKRAHWVAQLGPALHELGVSLIVAGRGLSAAPPDGHIVKIEEPSDDELTWLYSRATAFFYPSAYEGQGMPPIEAMAQGCPVIAFRNSAITETVGIDQFLVDDPLPWQLGDLSGPMPETTVHEILSRIVRWIDIAHDREEASVAARNRAAGFSYQGFSDRLASIYAGAHLV